VADGKTKNNTWYRRDHNTATDEKWRLISRRSKASICETIAVWDYFMDYASKQASRGYAGDVDPEMIAVAFDLEEEKVQSIINEFKDPKRKLMQEGFLINWSKYNPKTDAERKKEERLRKDKASQNVTACHEMSRAVTKCHADVTRCHEPSQNVTPTIQDNTEQEERKEKIYKKENPDSDFREITNPKPDKSKTPKQKFNPKALELPEHVPRRAWEDFVDMRQSIKKPLTERASELLLAELERLRTNGNDPGEVLNQSVMNCWQGLFEIKQTNGSYGHGANMRNVTPKKSAGDTIAEQINKIRSGEC